MSQPPKRRRPTYQPKSSSAPPILLFGGIGLAVVAVGGLALLDRQASESRRAPVDPVDELRREVDELQRRDDARSDRDALVGRLEGELKSAEDWLKQKEKDHKDGGFTTWGELEELRRKVDLLRGDLRDAKAGRPVEARRDPMSEEEAEALLRAREEYLRQVRGED